MSNYKFNPIDITIPIFILWGISQIVFGNHVLGGILILIGVGEFVIPRVGVSNLSNLRQPGVLGAWVIIVAFVCLVFHELYKNITS